MDNNLIIQLREKTHLQKAVITGNIEEVKELLSQSCDIDEKTYRGDTALMLAAEHGQLEILQLLIEAGANVNETNIIGENALTLASVLNAIAPGFNIERIEEILKKAGLKSGMDDMVSRAKKIQAMATALNKGSLIETEKEIASGALDIDGSLAYGNTPLHICAKNDEAIFKYFLDCGAHIDSVNLLGRSVLMTTILDDKPNIAEILLKKGASVDHKDSSGQTPLHHAAIKLNNGMVEKLLNKGASIDSTDNAGETPLIIAITVGGKEKGEIIRSNVILTLIKAGSDVNKTCENGKTPLITAVSSNGDEKHESVRVLLKAGADPSLKDKYGYDALYYAEGKEEIEKIIRQRMPKI